MTRETIAISLWHRFANSAVETWDDESYQAEYLHAVDDITTGQIFNLLLSRINFDGMDPRTFSLAELRDTIEGAEWPSVTVDAVNRKLRAALDAVKHGAEYPDELGDIIDDALAQESGPMAQDKRALLPKDGTSE